MPTTNLPIRGVENDLWSWPRDGSAAKLAQHQAWPPEIASLQHCRTMALTSALVVFVLAIIGQWIAYREQIHAWSDLRLVSSTIAAIATGILVFRVEVGKRAQSVATHARFEIISATNHHVRNALQVVIDNKYCAEGDERHLHEAIQRIHWVLTHVLPRVNR